MEEYGGYRHNIHHHSATLVLLFFTLHLIKRNDLRHIKQLETMNDIANRNPLTGVNNHRAFILSERRILASLAENPLHRYKQI